MLWDFEVVLHGHRPLIQQLSINLNVKIGK